MRPRNVALSVTAALLLWFVAVGAMGGAGSFERFVERGRTNARLAEALEGPNSPVGDYLLGQRAGETGVITSSAYRRALGQAEVLREQTAEDAPALAEATWSHLGPTNIGGRVVEIAVDPTAADRVFAATASGGVWKSTDAGLTWTSTWPATATQAMGAIAIASDGTIYAGTGEANPGGGSIVWGGTGLYRSEDAGATWQFIGLPDSGAIGRIAVDPTDPGHVFVAAAGNLFVPGGERGLYESTDRGATWSLALAGENETTGAIDIAVDPEDPDHLLAAMWDHIRLPTHRVYAGEGSGVYLSADGGDSWEEIDLPSKGVGDHQVGRIGVAFAPSDPSRAYAVIANKLNGNEVGFWRSNDGGASFSKTSATGGLSQSEYGWWFGKIWVDPADKDHVFVAGLELVESVNGGNAFVPHGVSTAGVVAGALHQTMPHADQHGMAWDPNKAGRVYLANDGGVYRSEANGRAGTWVGAISQGWTQHYSVDVQESDAGVVISGLQDNMCQKRDAVGGPGTWRKIGLCGDGLQTLINPVDPTWTYTCAQYGNCGVQRAEAIDPRRPGQVTTRPDGNSGRYGWFAPLEFDPSNPATMYFGSARVMRSTDNGITWTAISEDLTTNPDQEDPHDGYKIYGTITTIAVSKSDGNVIYAGTDDGLLWRTTDGGASWSLLEDPDDPDTEVDENDLPGTWVTRVAVDPANSEVAYATFSSFRNGSNAAHVVKTTDGGSSWSNVSGNLPDAPVNEIIVLPNDRLAVGTDVGVFVTQDGGATWHALGSNLPTIPVMDLRYHAGTNTITAATFGHGVQRVTLP